MSSSKTRDFSIVNMFLGIQDLPDVVTASKSYLLSPVVVDTPDSSSYWDLYQHCKYEGEGRNLAIVDAGIQMFHPAFASRRHPESFYHFVGDTSLTIGDCYGHGTLCAGVACGDPFQSTFDGSIVKCRGVAPKATLVVCKAYDRKGTRWYGVEALQRLIQVIDNENFKLDVVVLSSGCADQIPGLHVALKALDQASLLSVQPVMRVPKIRQQSATRHVIERPSVLDPMTDMEIDRLFHQLGKTWTSLLLENTSLAQTLLTL